MLVTLFILAAHVCLVLPQTVAQNEVLHGDVAILLDARNAQATSYATRLVSFFEAYIHADGVRFALITFDDRSASVQMTFNQSISLATVKNAIYKIAENEQHTSMKAPDILYAMETARGLYNPVNIETRIFQENVSNFAILMLSYPVQNTGKLISTIRRYGKDNSIIVYAFDVTRAGQPSMLRQQMDSSDFRYFASDEFLDMVDTLWRAQSDKACRFTLKRTPCEWYDAKCKRYRMVIITKPGTNCPANSSVECNVMQCYRGPDAPKQLGFGDDTNQNSAASSVAASEESSQTSTRTEEKMSPDHASINEAALADATAAAMPKHVTQTTSGQRPLTDIASALGINKRVTNSASTRSPTLLVHFSLIPDAQVSAGTGNVNGQMTNTKTTEQTVVNAASDDHNSMTAAGGQHKAIHTSNTFIETDGNSPRTTSRAIVSLSATTAVLNSTIQTYPISDAAFEKLENFTASLQRVRTITDNNPERLLSLGHATESQSLHTRAAAARAMEASMLVALSTHRGTETTMSTRTQQSGQTFTDYSFQSIVAYEKSNRNRTTRLSHTNTETTTIDNSDLSARNMNDGAAIIKDLSTSTILLIAGGTVLIVVVFLIMILVAMYSKQWHKKQPRRIVAPKRLLPLATAARSSKCNMGVQTGSSSEQCTSTSALAHFTNRGRSGSNG